MMLAPLMLLLAADPETAVEAERAFAQAAQTGGQWTAFRKWATEDATLFVPEPVNAQAWLKERNDPPKSVEWWPTESYVSCDGSFAVNTGGWRRPDGSVGYFTTVWKRHPDGGWKWTVDGGDALAAPRPIPEKPVVRKAVCRPIAPAILKLRPSAEIKSDTGSSEDGTLMWQWSVYPNGVRIFTAQLWNGKTFDTVVNDQIVPAK